MVNLIINDALADKLRMIAKSENRPVEDVLQTMVEKYVSDLSSGPADDDIEILSDVQDKAAYRATVREMRPKLYEIAREYWQRVGDQQRLAMTDEELDKEFWLIDHEGIPRLKSEKNNLELPADPLESLTGLFDDSDVSDASVTVRETMAEHYRKKYGRPD